MFALVCDLCDVLGFGCHVVNISVPKFIMGYIMRMLHVLFYSCGYSSMVPQCVVPLLGGDVT